MTLEEAKLEAQRRWGPDAFATFGWQISAPCEVGDHPIRMSRFGRGVTFTAAFASAEDRAKRTGWM